MTRYDWLLLDADGTLLDYPAAEAQALRQTLQDAAIPPDAPTVDAYQRINRGHWDALTRGETTPDRLRVERWADLLDHLDASHDASELAEAYVWHLGQAGILLDGALQATRDLAVDHRLCLVTNGLGDVQRSRLGVAELLDLFDVLVISDEIGFAKPDARYFSEAFARMGGPDPARTLMVGDHLDADIRGGAAAGCDPAWINPSRLPVPDSTRVTYDIATMAVLPDVLASA